MTNFPLIPEWSRALREVSTKELAFPSPELELPLEVRKTILDNRRALFAKIVTRLERVQGMEFTPLFFLSFATQTGLINHLLSDHFNPHMNFSEPLDLEIYFLKGYPMRPLIELLEKILLDEEIRWPMKIPPYFYHERPSESLGGWANPYNNRSEEEKIRIKQDFQRRILLFMKYIEHLEPGSIDFSKISPQLIGVYHSINLRSFIHQQWAFHTIIHNANIQEAALLQAIEETKTHLITALK